VTMVGSHILMDLPRGKAVLEVAVLSTPRSIQPLSEMLFEKYTKVLKN